MRALVVGLGHMGTFHRDTLCDLGYQVDTVDPYLLQANDPKERSNYATIGEALMARDYGIAAVAVPAPLLVQCAFELAGIKKLLVEKPFAPDPRQAAMLGAYLEARSDVCVGYIERFNPRVRELQERLAPIQVHVRSVRFTRYSDRPSADPVTDLLTHDVDLAQHLLRDKWSSRAVGLCSFDYACDQPQKTRRIEVDVNAPNHYSSNPPKDETWTFDLMDHGSISPLCALWHSFLMGENEVARPGDAVRALLHAEEVAASKKEEVAA